VSAKALLLSSASEGPVLARALLNAGFAISATVAAAVQTCQDFLHGARTGQGGT
jgi:hypothetical protein